MVDKSNRNEAHSDKWRLSAWISNSSAKQTPMMTWTLMAHLTIVYSTHFSMWLMCAYDVRMRRLSSQSGNCYNDRCWYNINASNKCSSFYFLGFSFHLVNTFFLSLFLKYLFHLAGWRRAKRHIQLLKSAFTWGYTQTHRYYHALLFSLHKWEYGAATHISFVSVLSILPVRCWANIILNDNRNRAQIE